MAANDKLEKVCVPQSLIESDILTGTYRGKSKAGDGVIDVRIRRMVSPLTPKEAKALKDEFKQIETDDDVRRAVRYRMACLINGSNVASKLADKNVEGIVENIFKKKYDFGDGSSAIYLMTRDYQPLADYEKEKGIDVKTAMKILDSVLGIMDSMHREGFVHRCIGMGSIFYDKEEDKFLLGKFDYAADLNEDIKLPIPLIDDPDVSENFISGLAASTDDDFEGFAKFANSLFGYNDYNEYESVSKSIDKLFGLAFVEPSKFGCKGLRKFLEKAYKDMTKMNLLDKPAKELLTEKKRTQEQKTAPKGFGLFRKEKEKEEIVPAPKPQETEEPRESSEKGVYTQLPPEHGEPYEQPEREEKHSAGPVPVAVVAPIKHEAPVATQPAPSPAQAQKQEPAPQPASEPKPEPAPAPKPEPAPAPKPEPAPQPAPAPKPEPAPAPKPEPAPAKAPEPAPAVRLEPVRVPRPEPAKQEPEYRPQPKPEPRQPEPQHDYAPSPGEFAKEAEQVQQEKPKGLFGKKKDKPAEQPSQEGKARPRIPAMLSKNKQEQQTPPQNGYIPSQVTNAGSQGNVSRERDARAFDTVPVSGFQMPTLNEQSRNAIPVQNIYNIYNMNGTEMNPNLPGFDPSKLYNVQQQQMAQQERKSSGAKYLPGFLALTVIVIVITAAIYLTNLNSVKYFMGGGFLSNKFNEPKIEEMLTVRPAKVSMKTGEQKALEFNMDSSTLTFTSADESVATVDANGVITAVGVGETKVYVVKDINQGKYVEIIVKE